MDSRLIAIYIILSCPTLQVGSEISQGYSENWEYNQEPPAKLHGRDIRWSLNYKSIQKGGGLRERE